MAVNMDMKPRRDVWLRRLVIAGVVAIAAFYLIPIMLFWLYD